MAELSFKDCPNGCVDGYYVDPYLHKRIQCDYCKSKRTGIVRDSVVLDNSDNLCDVLNLPKSFTGYGNFDIEEIIPTSESKLMLPDSISRVSDRMKSLLDSVSVGDVPKNSLMFNLGKRAFEDKFIYSYLVRAYMSGLTVSPYLSAYDVLTIRQLADSGSFEHRAKFNDLLHTDVCIVVIDTGVTKNGINAVKGLMQLRAHYDKSTIIFTNSWGSISDVKDLCSDDEILSRNLAELVSIEYSPKYEDKVNKSESSTAPVKVKNTAVGVSTDDFNNLLRPQKNVL